MSTYAVSNDSEEREPQRRHRSSDIATGTQWFYDVLGQVFGPLTSAQLLAKVKSGEIASNTPVRKDDSQWVNAEDVNGLFAAAQRKSYYKCPFCGNKIEKPPTTCLGCDRDVNAAYRVGQNQADIQKDTSGNRAAQPPADKTNGSSSPKKLFTWFKSLLDDGT